MNANTITWNLSTEQVGIYIEKTEKFISIKENLMKYQYAGFLVLALLILSHT